MRSVQQVPQTAKLKVYQCRTVSPYIFILVRYVAEKALGWCSGECASVAVRLLVLYLMVNSQDTCWYKHHSIKGKGIEVLRAQAAQHAFHSYGCYIAPNSFHFLFKPLDWWPHPQQALPSFSVMRLHTPTVQYSSLWLCRIICRYVDVASITSLSNMLVALLLRFEGECVCISWTKHLCLLCFLVSHCPEC